MICGFCKSIEMPSLIISICSCTKQTCIFCKKNTLIYGKDAFITYFTIPTDIAKQRHFSWSAWERKIEQMVDNYNFSICLWYIFWKLKPNNELCLLICYFEYLSFKICDIKDWEINTGVREYINLWHRMEKESSVLNLDSCTTGFTK